MFTVLKKCILFFLIVILLTSCATYYQKNIKFQEYISSSEFNKANELLEKDKKIQTGKNRILYLFNKGWVDWITNQNEKSNVSFEEANKSIEDYQKNYSLEALALISNPGIKPYKAEDFEVVMVNYFKALNYLNLGKYKDALIEVRRINEKLNQLNDKYPNYKNKYQDDAFAHIIMGLIYDANKEYNDAFIAYRNALNVYENSYMKNFNIQVPEQLKLDILRSAYRNGFYEELRFYEQKFNKKYIPKDNNGGELIFLWHNGLGPIKSEWSINFAKTSSKDGFITFANAEYGLTYPIYIGDKSEKEKSGFSKLSFLRIAFPKYIERKPVYDYAEINSNGEIYPLELAQDINAIAFKTLNDRMLREMGTAILRLATKKALEALANKENENLGSAVSIVNALTEKADTRNWQTLPYSIYYSRIQLPVGENNIQFFAKSKTGEKINENFKFNIIKGKTIFFSFSSLNSLLPVDK